MKPQKKTYGEAQKKHAVNLRLISRFSYAEIEAETGIPEAYVRKLVHEENAKTGTAVTQEGTKKSKVVTQEKERVTSEGTEQNTPENVEKTQDLKESGVTAKGFFSRHFSRMDCVFYATIATACIGAFNLIGWWFLLPCVPYALISVDALQTAKRPEMSDIANRGRTVVIVLELIAAVSNHSLFNGIFWTNIERLPVHIVKQGNAVLVGQEAASYAAGFVAACLFAAAFYAVDTTILKAKIEMK